MPLAAVQRTSVADAAFEQLLGAIVRGELAPDEQLPAERSLVEVLGVNRQAVREAVKRLEQAGLVAVRHGGGTTVLNLHDEAGLDALVLIVGAGGAVEPGVVRGILEMRRSLGADAAALCAQRARPEHIEGLRCTVGEQTAADADDLACLGALDWQFWTHVVHGADNLPYRLAFNSLRLCADSLGDLVALATACEWRDVGAHQALAEAIESSDADLAETLARDLLSGALGAVTALLTDDQPATRATRTRKTART